LSIDEGATIGFIGVGKMGAGMAKNVLRQGYPVVIWNRTAAKCDEHIEMGAVAAVSPKEVATKADVIICMLSTPLVTTNVILGLDEWQNQGVIDGTKPGSIVIDMSTNLPQTATSIATKLASLNVDFVDAPVIGSVNPANMGTLTILAGGTKNVVNRVKPILQSMGKKVWYIGTTGMGCTMKLTMNLHLNLITGAFAECLVFGTKAGLDPKLIVQIWNATIFKTYITETKGQKALDRDWSPAFAIELAAKDLNLAATIAQDVNAPIPLGGLVKQMLAATIANGKKDWDLCALVTTYEQMANLKIQPLTD
jgi:3-hydroxyisobutyrate dehydrogenase-like beta-hydroxyacid dehydrogenase